MKLRQALLIATACVFMSATANAEDGKSGDDGKKPYWGGLGKGYAGPFITGFGDLEGSLKTLFGPQTNVSEATLQVGGGGFGMINGFVIAGGGHAFLTPTIDGENGDLNLVGGGGGLAIGYAFYRTRDWIIYPYVGTNGYGLTLGVTNTSDVDIDLGGKTLEPGEGADLQTGFVAMDFGVSIQQLLFFGDGGFALGMDLGVLYTVAGGEWDDLDGEAMQNVGQAQMRGAYLRLNLGGGGFDFR